MSFSSPFSFNAKKLPGAWLNQSFEEVLIAYEMEMVVEGSPLRALQYAARFGRIKSLALLEKLLVPFFASVDEFIPWQRYIRAHASYAQMLNQGLKVYGILALFQYLPLDQGLDLLQEINIQEALKAHNALPASAALNSPVFKSFPLQAEAVHKELLKVLFKRIKRLQGQSRYSMINEQCRRRGFDFTHCLAFFFSLDESMLAFLARSYLKQKALESLAPYCLKSFFQHERFKSFLLKQAQLYLQRYLQEGFLSGEDEPAYRDFASADASAIDERTSAAERQFMEEALFKRVLKTLATHFFLTPDEESFQSVKSLLSRYRYPSNVRQAFLLAAIEVMESLEQQEGRLFTPQEIAKWFTVSIKFKCCGLHHTCHADPLSYLLNMDEKGRLNGPHALVSQVAVSLRDRFNRYYDPWGHASSTTPLLRHARRPGLSPQSSAQLNFRLKTIYEGVLSP